MDTITLLEERHGLVDGTNCSAIKSMSIGSMGGSISRLKDAHFNRVFNEVVHDMLNKEYGLLWISR